MNFIEGEFIYFDKPYGMTSFGALAFVRSRISRKMGVKRVKTGHAGTLDPLATGVLILCTGKKTKEIERLQLNSKVWLSQMPTRLCTLKQQCFRIIHCPPPILQELRLLWPIIQEVNDHAP